MRPRTRRARASRCRRTGSETPISKRRGRGAAQNQVLQRRLGALGPPEREAGPARTRAATSARGPGKASGSCPRTAAGRRRTATRASRIGNARCADSSREMSSTEHREREDDGLGRQRGGVPPSNARKRGERDIRSRHSQAAAAAASITASSDTRMHALRAAAARDLECERAHDPGEQQVLGQHRDDDRRSSSSVRCRALPLRPWLRHRVGRRRTVPRRRDATGVPVRSPADQLLVLPRRELGLAASARPETVPARTRRRRSARESAFSRRFRSTQRQMRRLRRAEQEALREPQHVERAEHDARRPRSR